MQNRLNRFLHYNFVCALLNDLFGVQSRGGCQCAGPYSQSLLGMSLADTRAVEAELLHKHELLRPGFSRLSLSYVNSDREVRTKKKWKINFGLWKRSAPVLSRFFW